MELWSIGELARRVGIEASALRYYEEIGLLPPPPRVSGQRRYTPDYLDTIRLIQVGKAAGFRLDEIQTLVCGLPDTAGLSERWKAMAGRKLAEIDALIEQAQDMKRLIELALLCNCTSLNECLLLDGYEAMRHKPTGGTP